MKFPRQREVFYLRHILLHFPQYSFADCRRHGSVTYETYEERMLATGFFARDDEASCVLGELVSLRYSSAQLRFAFLVLLDLDAHPTTLFNKFQTYLMKDFCDRGLSPAHAETELLKALRNSWVAMGNDAESWTLGGHTDYESQMAAESRRVGPAQSYYAMVQGDPHQDRIAKKILRLIAEKREAMTFVQGRAGSGKSTLATYLNHAVEDSGLGVVNVATTGIAALQLPHGSTAHTQFKIPLDDIDNLTCTLGLQTDKALAITTASLVQWDEWPSCKRTAWEAVLRLFQALQKQHREIYVPKVFVCYGDFRQIPLVIRGGSREAVVRMSVRQSPSWHRFTHFVLPFSHRQKQDPAYAAWIEKIGQGTLEASHSVGTERGYVSLDMCALVSTPAEAIRFCFPHLNDPHAALRSKILATTNEAVDAFNAEIMRQLVQDYKLASFVKYSADFLDSDLHDSFLADTVSNEFLNAQLEPGVPPHKLHVVVGGLYELMRNFCPADRLMNHTPVIVRAVYDRHLLIETMQGQQFPLPRICFRWTLARGTAIIVRRQYPLRPAYASTYNGAQSNTLERCCVDLRRSPFTHGHLYVALGTMSLVEFGSVAVGAHPPSPLSSSYHYG